MRTGTSGSRVARRRHERFATASARPEESALVSVPQVAEAAVVGHPHPVKGEGIYAYVTVKEGTVIDDDLRAELCNHVRSNIGPIATPDVIHFANALLKRAAVNGETTRKCCAEMERSVRLLPRCLGAFRGARTHPRDEAHERLEGPLAHDRPRSVERTRGRFRGRAAYIDKHRDITGSRPQSLT